MSLLVRCPGILLLSRTNMFETDEFLSHDFISKQCISTNIFEYEVNQVYALMFLQNIFEWRQW